MVIGMSYFYGFDILLTALDLLNLFIKIRYGALSIGDGGALFAESIGARFLGAGDEFFFASGLASFFCFRL